MSRLQFGCRGGRVFFSRTTLWLCLAGKRRQAQLHLHCNARKRPPTMHATVTSLLLLLLAPLALQAKSVLAYCSAGCNIGCACATPFFTCNPHGGTCAYTACDGSCDLATWVIAVIVVACVLAVVGFMACCCGAQLHECCCSRRYTSTVGLQPLPVTGFYAALPPDKSTELGARLMGPAH